MEVVHVSVAATRIGDEAEPSADVQALNFAVFEARRRATRRPSDARKSSIEHVVCYLLPSDGKIQSVSHAYRVAGS